MNLKNILIAYTQPQNREESLTLEIVKNTLKNSKGIFGLPKNSKNFSSTLKKYKINYKLANRDKLNKAQFKNKDLIIAVGGDGTFLRAAQYIFDKTPILGVNSDPKSKEGFLLTTTKKDFEDKLAKVIKNKYKIRKLQRLEAYINNKKIPVLALNEFYIAAEKPYNTARYYLTVRGKKEKQKSSGILVSTAAGSHAWTKSAGGKTLPLESKKFQYIVRELYCGKVSAKCKLVNHILGGNEKLIIEFEVGKAIMIADSMSKEYKFKARKKIVVKVSKKPLYSIHFN